MLVFEKEKIMKTSEYIRCPRCELNYIHKKDKFCEVCKQEMQVGGGEDISDLDLELCPICKTNYIQPDEVMCATCLAEHNSADSVNDDSEDWESYIQRDDEENDDANEEIGDMASIKTFGEDDDDVLDSDIDDDEDDIDFSEDMDDEDKDNGKDDENKDEDDFDEDLDIDDFGEDDEEDEYDDDDE